MAQVFKGINIFIWGFEGFLRERNEKGLCIMERGIEDFGDFLWSQIVLIS